MNHTKDVPIVIKRYSKVVKLVMELHHESLKVVEFMMKLYYRSLEQGEASIEALPHGLLHPCELVTDQI